MSLDTERHRLEYAATEPPDNHLDQAADANRAPQAVANIHKTLQGLGADKPLALDKPAEQLTIAETVKLLTARREQLGQLLNLVKDASSDAHKLATLREANKLCPQLSSEEIVAIINAPELVRSHAGLQDAIIVGGKRLNHGEKSASIYTLHTVLGAGGMGQVKDGFLLKEGKWEAVAIKEPKIAPATTVPDIAAANLQRHNNYLIEAENAATHLQEPIPHVLKVAFVSEPQPETGLPVIAYEKVVDRTGKTQNLATVFDQQTLAPSRKVAAFATAIQGIAELHARGLVHYDFKPDNVAINSQGEGVVIDPGSLFAQNQVLAQPREGRREGGIFRSFEKDGNRQMLQLAYTPYYMDNDKVFEGARQGKPLSIADRYAIGMSIEHFLLVSNFISQDAMSPAKIQRDLNIGADYPPASIKALEKLRQELKDIHTNTPLRPLPEIIADLKAIAQQMQSDADLIHQQWLTQKYKLQQTTQL